MKYSNEDVRRQDRLMSEADAIKLLTDGEYGVLSMQAEDGGGYGVPLNYVFDGQHSLYMHLLRKDANFAVSRRIHR